MPRDETVTLDDPTGEEPPPPAPPVWEVLGLLGSGGMGDVHRVRDTALDRIVAMKVLRADLRGNARARFQAEARLTAGLQHPGVVPVHAVGELPDGRPFFVMQEVVGRTLQEVIAAVHAASPLAWQATPDGWTLRRLVSALRQVCQTLAYAHERGVLHCDLKPENVMVGDHGEVLVVDWGLARPVASEPDAVPPARVTGTPAYMAPEQVSGGPLGPATDVYALGAILYEILSGRPPYAGPTASSVLQKVLGGAPTPVWWRGQPGVASKTVDQVFSLEDPTTERTTGDAVEVSGFLPVELVELCERAMAREPSARFAGAAAMASALEAWLDGSHRQERARALLEDAAQHQLVATALTEEALALRAAARRGLDALPTWAGEDTKAPFWALRERAEQAEHEAGLRRVEHERQVVAAVTCAPELPEPHAALASLRRAEHAAAEAARDRAAAARAEVLLRAELDALPPTHPLRRSGAAYLVGEGRLTLHTDPPGAEVDLFRYVRRSRRLFAERVGPLGRTPILERPLPMGSYLCVLSHPDHAPVRYPVHLGRQGCWATPEPVLLGVPCGPDEVYVPEGPFLAGGDPEAHQAGPARQIWCHGFVIERFPVTNGQYLAFLDDLVARGEESLALAAAPRERHSNPDALGPLIVGRGPDGRFVLVADADGDRWEPDMPAVMLPWEAAMAYADWRAARDGLPWRLPAELEWEKAARGVDGRAFPWGDEFDASRALCRASREHGRGPAPVDSFPIDTSVYGVRGMAGNVRSWCLDPDVRGPVLTDRVQVPTDRTPGTQRAFRGGAWASVERTCRSAYRFGADTRTRLADLGIRLVRPVA